MRRASTCILVIFIWDLAAITFTAAAGAITLECIADEVPSGLTRWKSDDQYPGQKQNKG
ncbi:MAG: hypothetical protein V1784_03505 [bacterium]